LSLSESNSVRCPHAETAEKMLARIREVKMQGDSIGGIVTCVITGVSAGIGEPVFDKLHARLAEAMMSINAAHGFDYGKGFDGVALRGSESNDEFVPANGGITTLSNNSGGVQGGISNGQDIYFRVLFKATATIFKNQQSVDIHGNAVEFKAKGRHDPCVVPRAVPVVEAMAAITLLDLIMMKPAV
jgi:chorismate synthase